MRGGGEGRGWGEGVRGGGGDDKWMKKMVKPVILEWLMRAAVLYIELLLWFETAVLKVLGGGGGGVQNWVAALENLLA